MFAGVFICRKILIFPIRPCVASQIRSREAGRRVRERYGIRQVAPWVFWDKAKGRHASEAHGKQILASPAPGPAAGRRRCAALALLRFRKARVLPCRPAPGRAASTPSSRCYLRQSSCAPCCAWWGQALLLQAPPAGRPGRPCRASGCLLIASRESGALTLHTSKFSAEQRKWRLEVVGARRVQKRPNGCPRTTKLCVGDNTPCSSR